MQVGVLDITDEIIGRATDLAEVVLPQDTLLSLPFFLGMLSDVKIHRLLEGGKVAEPFRDVLGTAHGVGGGPSVFVAVCVLLIEKRRVAARRTRYLQQIAASVVDVYVALANFEAKGAVGIHPLDQGPESAPFF